MPVDISVEWQKGWGKNRTLKDPVMVIVFTNRINRKVLFQYAPRYDDLPIILNAMGELIVYEGKKIKALKQKIKTPCKSIKKPQARKKQNRYLTRDDELGDDEYEMCEKS